MALPSYGQNIAQVDLAALIAAISGSGSFVTSVTGTPNQVTVTPVPGVGAVTVSLPTSGTLPGAWHAATGFVVDAGALSFGAAASQIIPGATSFAIRNNANSANNVLVSDAGIATFRAGMVLTAGQVLLPDGSVASPALSWSNSVGSGRSKRAAVSTYFESVDGNKVFGWNATDLVFAAAYAIGWGTDPGVVSPDLLLYRDAANVLAQRNGTTAQSFRVYNTYSGGGTDYERIGLSWSSNVATLASEAGGTGTVRQLVIRLPHGVAPASPINGDVWTTTVAQYNRINGVTEEVMYV